MLLMSLLSLQHDICEQARLTRDRRFDGLFFTGVISTGIFCRSICPAPSPKAANVRYFRTAAAAFQAGLRPCLRCRPEAAPGSLAWNNVEPLVQTAVKMIDAGFLHNRSVDELADRLGISNRHLRRLFRQHLGTTPLAYARMQQTLFAKQLLTDSGLSVTDIAMASAFSSIRRFNDHFKSVYGRSPRELRKNLKQASRQDNGCQLTIGYRVPYDFAGLLAFYAYRAIPGIEHVTSNSYARTFELNDTQGWFRVTDMPKKQALNIELHCNRYDQLQAVVQRIRQVLDVDADADSIRAHFKQVGGLTEWVSRAPGIRIPGCWSIGEAAVRAVLGQRVTVTASISMLKRLADEYSNELPNDILADAPDTLCCLFPRLSQLQNMDAKQLRMGRAQAATIGRLYSIDDTGQITADDLYRELVAVKGIGDWSAQYILLRGLSFPDAWLAGDVVIKKQLAKLNSNDDASQQWQPWRAYALLYIWRYATEIDNA